MGCRTIRVNVQPGAFNDVYYRHLTNEHRYQLFYGGASSGKSYFLAQRVVINTMQGRNTLVVRNTANTIRKSCWNEIVKSIRNMGVSALFKVAKTEMVIECAQNGAQILFCGLDDVEKVKSITPANGVLTDIWIEEATEIEYNDYKQLDKRLRGESTFSKRITFSFNPVYKTHWLYSEFFGIWDESKRYAESERASILKTTYRDNRFLTRDDVYAIENERDEYYREVYTFGNWGILGDVIFKNWHVEDLSEYIKTADKLLFGLDFGFSVDPCGVVKVRYDRARRRVYILGEIYERGLTNTMLGKEVKRFAGNKIVTCDSAEPKSIAELRGCGVSAIGAKKGPDSVMYGIQWLQGNEIIVDKRCQNMCNELTMYQWRKDKDGNSIRQPEDRNNHLIDALRYALEGESARIADAMPPHDYGNQRESYWKRDER